MQRYSLYQGLNVEGFAQVSDRPGTHALLAQTRQVVRCDDDDRKLRTRPPQRLLDLSARQTGHLQVEHQAIGPIEMPLL
jgi:hypothetical protein